LDDYEPDCIDKQMVSENEKQFAISSKKTELSTLT